MKELVYRVLAGFFGLGFGIFLSIGNTSYLSNKMYISSWAIAIGFGLFAILGTHIAESFLAKFLAWKGPTKFQLLRNPVMRRKPLVRERMNGSDALL